MSTEKFIEWNPKPESVELLGKVIKVVEDYKAMEITMTLRQLYYQLVSQNIVPNVQRAYKNLGSLLSKARLGGFVDWDAIEDRVRQPNLPSQWQSIQGIVDAAVRGFRLPRWADQPYYVELWCEKDALASVLEPVTDELHVTQMINRGYSSTSAM